MYRMNVYAVAGSAAIQNLMAVEHHGLDMSFWADLVTGPPDDYLTDGCVEVPIVPGLDLNLDVAKANLRDPGTLFQSTEAWSKRKIGFERVEPPRYQVQLVR